MHCAGKSLQQYVQTLDNDKMDQTSACTCTCMSLGHCEVPELSTAISSVPAPEELKAAAASFASKIGAAQAKSVLLDSKETCEFCRV